MFVTKINLLNIFLLSFPKANTFVDLVFNNIYLFFFSYQIFFYLSNMFNGEVEIYCMVCWPLIHCLRVKPEVNLAVIAGEKEQKTILHVKLCINLEHFLCGLDISSFCFPEIFLIVCKILHCYANAINTDKKCSAMLDIYLKINLNTRKWFFSIFKEAGSLK